MKCSFFFSFYIFVLDWEDFQFIHIQFNSTQLKHEQMSETIEKKKKIRSLHSKHFIFSVVNQFTNGIVSRREHSNYLNNKQNK